MGKGMKIKKYLLVGAALLLAGLAIAAVLRHGVDTITTCDGISCTTTEYHWSLHTDGSMTFWESSYTFPDPNFTVVTVAHD